MERIQSAIAKARAERAATVPEAPADLAGAAADVSPAVPDATLLAAAWSRLTALQFKPSLISENRIVAFEGGPDSVVFDVMRTRLIQQIRANGWRRVAITSPTPSCGKSTVALNLAFSLARQRDLRTVLAEVDLRRPALAKLIGASVTHSFADMLAERATMAEAAMRHEIGLAIIANAGPVRNSAELLQARQVPGILNMIEADYAPDVMLFDMPPVLVSDDAMAFMGQVDAVLIVAAADQTTTREVDLCERELASLTNVMGVVLNKCRFIGPEYGYGYYYG
jgi:protein-tyrosine kinase